MKGSVAFLLALAAAASLAAAPTPYTARRLLRDFVAAINRGDERAYGRFATMRFAPAALRDYAADLQASELAKIYTDTQGITLDRIVRVGPSWIQGEGRDHMSGTRQCLTVNFATISGKARITDYSIRGLYKAGPKLATPSARQVVEILGGLAGRFDRRGLMSGV